MKTVAAGRGARAGLPPLAPRRTALGPAAPAACRCNPAAASADASSSSSSISSTLPTTSSSSAAVDAAPATRRQSLAALLAGGAAAFGAASLAAAPAASAAGDGSEPDLTITDTIFLEFGVADTAFKAPGERTLGDRTIIPAPSAALGRLEIGLYGNACPATVKNMLAAVHSGALNGTVVSRISPGEFVQIGRQGSRRLGELENVPGLSPNTDVSSPAGFKLTHGRPGTVSLSISGDNDEDPAVKEKTGYRPLEFLITTGPGPVPRLDGLNLVYGRVTQGLTTVAAIAAVPSFQPDARSQQLNAFAKFIGDDRADKVRRRYGRPLKAIVITSSGVVGEGAAASAAGPAVAAALSG